MTDYKQYLAEERIPTAVPEDVVDGSAGFTTEPISRSLKT